MLTASRNSEHILKYIEIVRKFWTPVVVHRKVTLKVKDRITKNKEHLQKIKNILYTFFKVCLHKLKRASEWWQQIFRMRFGQRQQYTTVLILQHNIPK